MAQQRATPAATPPRRRRPATDEEAKALASTLRMRILRVCGGEARSNKEIAEALSRDPATTLHHVRRLVDTGFLAAQPVRRGRRGSREIPYLSTGKSWTLESPAQNRVLLDAFLEEVSLVPAERMHTTRLGLRLPPEQFEELEQRLQQLFDEFADRPHDPSGEARSLFFAIHPDPNQP